MPYSSGVLCSFSLKTVAALVPELLLELDLGIEVGPAVWTVEGDEAVSLEKVLSA